MRKLAVVSMAMAAVAVTLLVIWRTRASNTVGDASVENEVARAKLVRHVSGGDNRRPDDVAANELRQAEGRIASPDEIRRARKQLQKLKEALCRKDGSWRSAADELCTMESPAVQAIRVEAGEWETRDALRLVRILGGIAGDESTGLLLDLALDKGRPELARAALSALENRPVRRSLSESELRSLSDLIQQEGVLLAGMGARVLGKCERVPGEKRVEIALMRFLKELENPTDTGRIRSTYVSPQVHVLNQFLLSFSYTGEDAIPALRQAAEDAQTDAHKNWLHLALGMAGDQGVAKSVGVLVASHPDKYVRTLAVRAYARALGMEAVPFLESLLRDETQSEYGDRRMGPIYLIRNTAQDELARLRTSSP